VEDVLDDAVAISMWRSIALVPLLVSEVGLLVSE